jgi:twitching motility protein PilT
MAILDRYLEAMTRQRAEGLLFRTGSPVEMFVGGTGKPVSSKPVAADQIEVLLTEVLGSSAEKALTRPGGGTADFPYKSPHGAMVISISRGPTGLMARVQPAPAPAAAEARSAPAPAARPIAPGSSVAVRPLAATGTPVMPTKIEELFHQMLDLGASDLHLKGGRQPMLRVDGDMVVAPDRPALPPETVADLVLAIMPTRNQEQFRDTHDTDFAHEVIGRARMRCNVFRDLAGVGAVFRQIPSKILTAQQLNLPRAVMDLCELEKGLVVVTGPTGSGKSTTLAAMVDSINATRDEHIITIEDPVEFVHHDKRCLVNQREVGPMTLGFKAALRAALREDPDIVLVGEMRDLETVAIAIETAETGHLVFGTLHTNTAPSTVDRIIDQFPSDRQSQVRTMLSESLKGVVAQTLLKKKGGGRIAALEILIVTSAVANLIREGKTFQIASQMQTGRNVGMQTMNDAILELVKNDLVEPQEAFDRAVVRKEMALLLTRSGFKGPWSEGLPS